MTEGPRGPVTDQNPTVLSTVQIQSKEMILSPKSSHISIKWKNFIIDRLMTMSEQPFLLCLVQESSTGLL